MNLLRRFTREMPLGGLDAPYDAYWRRREDDAAARADRAMRPWHRNAIAARLVPPGASVLDVGCGPGKLLEALRRLRPDLELHGVDISAEAVARARAKGFDAEVRDVAADPPERDYDTICLMTVLEHIPDAEAVMRALIPRCRRQFLVAIPNLGFVEHRLRLALFGRMPLTGVWYDVREHVRFWTVRDFRHWVRALGLELAGIHATHGSWLRRAMPSLLASQIVYDVRVPSAARTARPHAAPAALARDDGRARARPAHDAIAHSERDETARVRA